MPRRAAVRLAALLVVVAVAAVSTVVAVEALGGEGRPTEAEYLAEVAAICKEYGERLDRIAPPGDISSPGAVVSSIATALPVLRAQLRAVRALRAPRSLEADLERFFTLTDRSLDELQEAHDAAFERELFPMAKALTRFGEVRDEAKAISRALGFHC